MILSNINKIDPLILEKVVIENGKYQFICSDNKFFDDNKILDFPFVKFSTPISEIIESWVNMKKCDYLKKNEKILSPGIKTDGLFMGEPVQLIMDYDYRKFRLMINYFTDKCRLLSRSINDLQSAYELFMNKREVIREKTFENFKQLSSENIIKTFLQLYSPILISEFNPVWSFCVIRFFEKLITINDVLDMSAGRGSRLAGTLAAGKNYTGVDPNDCVDYDTIVNFFNCIDGSKRAKIHKSGFETVDLGDEMFDLMFSSPPYFNYEIYSQSEADSTVKFPEMDNWLENFLKYSMQKIINHLRPGGIMAINIDNPKTEPMDYVNPMLDFKFQDATYIGMFSIGRESNYQMVYISVWCWQKNKN